MSEELKAPINEMFYSIQGEGKNLGKPALFIRLFGCNLRCRFNGENCDTPYAVLPGAPGANNEMYTSKDIVKKIKSLGVTHIVWTGGEPMLYQDFILECMEKCDFFVTGEIETNGTIAPNPKLNKYIELYTISPKLKSSNQELVKYNRIRKNITPIYGFPPDKSYFKFVVTCKEDINEIKKLNFKFPRFDVYLMPQGTTREEIIKNAPEIVEYCKKYDYKFSPREHLIIYDKKRGV